MAEIAVGVTPRAVRRHARGGTLSVHAATVAVLIVAYELLAQSGLLFAGVVPSLVLIGRALLETLSKLDFYWHLGVTSLEALVGFAIGSAAGFLLGLCFAFWRPLGKIFNPWVQSLAYTPKIIFLPIFGLLFGTGIGSKVAMGAGSAFFPVAIAAYASALGVRPILLRVIQSYGASAWQTMRLVYLPAIAGPALVGMRIGLGAAIVGSLLAEIKMSRSGVGYLIIQAYNMFLFPRCMR